MQDRDLEIKCGNTHVYFALKGDDFNPQDITNKIGVLPTSCSIKGSAGRYNPSLKFSSWIISSNKGIGNFDVEMLIDELIQKLVDRIEIINELKADFNLRSILQIVLDIDVNPVESTLSLGFNQNIIRFLYLTNTVIDVDIYRFSSTDKYE